MKLRLLLVASLVLIPAVALAQQIPPPAGPVTFCGTQATPVADSYQVIIDGGTPAPLNMDATKNASCAASDTHSFQLPASHFTVGKHTVQVVGINTFGSTPGPSFEVVVGIAPGQFTVTSVVTPQVQQLRSQQPKAKPTQK